MIELFAACANTVVPEATEQAMRYYNSGNFLWALEQLWGFAIPFLFLVKGFTGKLEKFSEKWGKKWFFSLALYLVIYTLIAQFLNFPLDFYGDFTREHTYGLSSQSFGRWIEVYGLDLLISMLGLVAFVWVFYLLLEKSPRRWWFYSSLVSVGIMFFMMLIQPIWIDPLFNKFGPMKDKELEGQILGLAAKAGIENGRVFEVNKSEDTKTMNAYVIGIGSSSRIVLWDTTIQALKPRELLFVMGHEMGHYVLNHIWWSLLYYSLLSFAIFYLTYRSAHFLLKRYHRRFGFKQLHNIASFPLLILLTSFYGFLFTPLSNCVSRAMEHEADRFGLEITHDNQAAGEAFLVLQAGNLSNPHPGFWFKLWRATHPSIQDRVDFFNEYCPWIEGEKEEGHKPQCTSCDLVVE